MVGASLACALAQTRLTVAIVESVPFAANEQPSFDQRTVALTYGSRLIFEGLAVWTHIAEQGAFPILRIHVSDRGHLGVTRLDHTLVGTEALGYLVPHRTIGNILYQHVRANPNATLFSPARAVDVNPEESHVEAIIDDNGTTRRLRGRVIVIADGGCSELASQLGFRVTHTPYRKAALVGTIDVDRDHHGTAYERFTSNGPLALLPMSARRYALVWTLPETDAKDVLSLSNEGYVERLQESFGGRAGCFSQPGSRHLYSLSLRQVTSLDRHRMVVIGNAAHTLHPVAGQGFNLGLRDVAVLAETFGDAEVRSIDIGKRNVLNGYARQRQRDTRAAVTFTHGLISLFTNRSLPFVIARNVGLVGIDLLPPVKRTLLRRTMGLYGRRSRLALGLPLRGD